MILLQLHGNIRLNLGDAILQIIFNLGTPKTDYRPSLFHQIIIDFLVSLHVSFDFFVPKFWIALESVFLGFPIFAVKKFAVNK